MKKSFFTFSVCCIFFFPLLYQANAAPTDSVTIPDDVLRAAIETRLGKSAGATITEADMASLGVADNLQYGTTLTIQYGQLKESNERIDDLTGLEYAINITALALDLNNIKDLTPLQNMTQLTSVVMNFNPITDLTPLQNLEEGNLTTLSFQRQNSDTTAAITDLSPLKNLKTLEILYFTNNDIVDISHLSGLTALTELYMRDNQITNTSHLRNLRALEKLDLRSNKITDISQLSQLTALTVLRLSSNRNLSNISVVQHFENLTELSLSSTSITHAGLSAVLPSLSALTSLYIARDNISDLSVLGKLPMGLETLGVYNMSSNPDPILTFKRGNGTGGGWLLTDLSPLVDNPKITENITTLDLDWNYSLDYESLYTDLPVLIGKNISNFYYSQPVEPRLEGKSAKDYVGRPQTRHTFVVQAYNTTTGRGGATFENDKFAKVPVTWTVTKPDRSTDTSMVLTDDNGLAQVSVILGNHDDVHTAEAVVSAKQNTHGPSHDKLRVSFMATADRDAPPPPIPPIPTPDPSAPRLTVTFEDYPEDKPIDEFSLTIKFSQPVTGFQKEDITAETQLKTGKGTATLEALTPVGGVAPIAGLEEGGISAQTYTARIGLPARATGTVKLIVSAEAATSILGNIGPATDTASEPIEFGERRRVLVFPSHVAMDKVIFNELRNVADDTHDWIELKNISDEAVSLKEWEISIVASEDEPHYVDRDIVEFPDWTLPPSGILLILNTDPSETDLLRGQDIENPHHNLKLRPWYLIRPEMKLPKTPYLLILRNARDKNGKWEGFEDLVGDYHRGDVNYRTQIWPLRDTWVYTGTGARLSEAEAWQRVMRPKGAIPMKPMKRGYFHNAWVMSDYQSGLGYDPDASPETSLGTPGYTTLLEDNVGTGHISFSEVMFATNERGLPSQWVELYNNSATEIVDLEGWKLTIEVRDSRSIHRHITFHFKPLEVMPNQTVLLVTRNDRTSGNIPVRRIYDVQRQNRKALLLRSEGFALRLFSPDGTLVDMAGNLDGRMGQDKPRWPLPSGWSESGERSSLIRRYEDRVPWQGTVPGSWVRASETALLMGYSYWGLPTDNGTPGYRQGSPLPVELSSVRADLREGSIVVNWTTASEMENAGFNILRSETKKGEFVKVNPTLILGAGTTAEGQTYMYRDTTAAANVPYYYRLEEVSLSGERRAVATVRLRGYVSAANKHLWKWADVKSTD